MARNPGPTLRRRELGARLRELRLQQDLTIDEVASRLLVSSTKISRLETGARGVRLRDVRDLCELYGVDDEVRGRLLALVKESYESSWWQRYDEPYATWVGLEAAAASIFDYKSSVVPGLLQAEGYCRAVLKETLVSPTAEHVERLVTSRRTRQARLVGDQPVRVHTILDEAVLRRVIGGPIVMRDQVQILIERAEQPNVDIQIVPFEVGAHPALESNFMLLQFDESVSDVVCVEGLLGTHYLEGNVNLLRYHRVFGRLREIALSPRDSVTKLAAIARQYPAE